MCWALVTGVRFISAVQNWHHNDQEIAGCSSWAITETKTLLFAHYCLSTSDFTWFFPSLRVENRAMNAPPPGHLIGATPASEPHRIPRSLSLSLSLSSPFSLLSLDVRTKNLSSLVVMQRTNTRDHLDHVVIGLQFLYTGIDVRDFSYPRITFKRMMHAGYMIKLHKMHLSCTKLRPWLWKFRQGASTTSTTPQAEVQVRLRNTNVFRKHLRHLVFLEQDWLITHN